MKLDSNLNWKALEARAGVETDPKLRANLEIVIEHIKAEALGDFPRVLKTLSEKPKYIWRANPDDPEWNPEGSRQAVMDFYDRFLVQSGAYRAEYDVERVMVDESAVLTEGLERLAYPGRTLLEMGIEIDDPDAFYLAEGHATVVWPIEPDTGLIVGEEISFCTDMLAGIADRKITFDDIIPLEISG